jgi:hypothetical protein
MVKTKLFPYIRTRSQALCLFDTFFLELIKILELYGRTIKVEGMVGPATKKALGIK